MSNQSSKQPVTYCSQGCTGHTISKEVCTEFGPIIERSEDDIFDYEPSDAELLMTPPAGAEYQIDLGIDCPF